MPDKSQRTFKNNKIRLTQKYIINVYTILNSFIGMLFAVVFIPTISLTLSGMGPVSTFTNGRPASCNKSLISVRRAVRPLRSDSSTTLKPRKDLSAVRSRPTSSGRFVRLTIGWSRTIFYLEIGYYVSTWRSIWKYFLECPLKDRKTVVFVGKREQIKYSVFRPGKVVSFPFIICQN